MQRNRFSALVLPLLVSAAPLAAQTYYETFSVPSIPSLPPVLGWTIQDGSFSVVNGRLRGDGSSTWAYITKDGANALNCVIEAEMFTVGTALQFCGLTARYTSATSTLMCKVQQNSASSNGWNYVYLYQRTTGKTTQAPLAKFSPSVIARMIVLDGSYTMQVDFDKDGAYDQTILSAPITTMNSAGGTGLNVYRTAELDNFKYFDAILQPQGAAQPKIGTTFQMDLKTEGTQLTPWRIALSLGNKGFPIGTRRIPLDVDPVFNLSLALSGPLGLGGLTDSSGDATPGLVIPNQPVLIGLGVFAAAITLDGSKPEGIGYISNDLHIRFQ